MSPQDTTTTFENPWPEDSFNNAVKLATNEDGFSMLAVHPTFEAAFCRLLEVPFEKKGCLLQVKWDLYEDSCDFYYCAGKHKNMNMATL